MADKNSNQRSSTSLFGNSSSTQSIQEIIRERRQASQARRKWLFSWLLPLVAVILVGGVSLYFYLDWKERKNEEAIQARANVVDPMRGITFYGNEEAAVNLAVEVPDMIIAPRDLLTVLHRAAGIKPYKVCLKVVDLQQRDGMEQGLEGKLAVYINGKQEAEYLDEKGERQTISIVERKDYTLEQLAGAITLAYHDAYGDDDLEHPFHITIPTPKAPKKRHEEDNIDLNVGRLNQTP